MRLTIRYQLIVPLLLLLAGVAGVSVWSAWIAVRTARGQIETKLRGVASTLGSSDFPLTQRVLEQMRGLSGAEYVVVNDEGHVISTFLPDEVPSKLPSDNIADDWRKISLSQSAEVGGVAYMCSGLQLRRGGGRQTLYIFYPESLWRDALWQAIIPSLVFGLVGGGLALGLALSIAQRLGRRINELERRTRMIAAGDSSPMPVPSQVDEIQELCQSINEMARRLSDLQETVKKTERLRLLGQVSGGMAHQMRNAVAGARLAVQLHARECMGPPDDDALGVALRQLSLVETNIKRFLDLGKDQELKRDVSSLVEILDEAVRLVQPQCKHAHIDLRWRPPMDALEINADREQLTDLFVNILVNAVEAAGPNGWVEVRVSDRQARLSIDIRDSGKGPPPDVAKRLFEPFVSGKREGIGLGLVVARRVAEAHGGSIQWRQNEGPTWFSIELPMAQRVEAVS